MVLGDNFPDVSNPNTIIYKFNTSQMNFIQNEHVKLDETFLDVQGRLKAYLSNALDIFGYLTSKHHKTLNNAYKYYIKSINNIKTPWTTHKHIEPHFRHLGDLVVERLGRPLTFDFQIL